MKPAARRPAWLALFGLLAAAIVVAASWVYWHDLRGSVARLQQSVALARAQQQMLAERARAAEAAVRERDQRPARARPDTADPTTLQRQLARAAADVERLAAAVADAQASVQAGPPAGNPFGGPTDGRLQLGPRAAPLDLRQVQAELGALARDAFHLPLMRYLPPPGVPEPPLLLRGQDLRALLRQAQDSAALGDLALLTSQVAGARRLLGYYRQEPRALALARRLEALLGRLDRASGATDAEVRLQRLASELRALADELPAGARPGPGPGPGPGPVPGPVPGPAAPAGLVPPGAAALPR